MTIGIDGMASGLDTGAIIDGLVAIQRNQQVLLKQKSSVASSIVTALQALNSRVASLATAGEKVAAPASWAVTKASSSSDAVTVSAAPNAKPGVVELRVDRLASGQVSLVDPAALTGPFTITVGGTDHEVAPSSPHIDDVVAAINDARGTTGVSATKLRTGTDGDGNAVYGLQLTGATGSGGAFSLTAGGQDVAATTLAQAGDAEVTLWPSAGGSHRLTSTTNTFDGLLDGVDLTVSTVSADPVRVTVATDPAAQVALADELVGNVSIVLSEIASRTRTTTSTDAAGNTVVSGGVFSGDSAIRFLTSDIQSAVTRPVDGRSPSSVGISLDRYGAISLDKAAFTKALTEDPEGATAMIQAIAGRVAEVAERASSSAEGTITRKITSQESVVKDLGSQVAKWDQRLDARRAQLVAQFSAMEVRLSQLQSTQSWLTNQIAGLTASSQQ
ncbi:hypothetical protein FE251_01310 [Georgenia wutianyii]|uniref:Flagellar hook-associated protein 2 n=1 Tax=Georgenia wutianyii TaxID=2585135 RepID=A0ABX5VNN8_9MICO|nr:flagellar filament capping protein FliD [Georgenia wutianyii]QDB78160.1 hypothetical protein FE251_01310 [Georgenia wutianyii]